MTKASSNCVTAQTERRSERERERERERKREGEREREREREREKEREKEWTVCGLVSIRKEILDSEHYDSDFDF